MAWQSALNLSPSERQILGKYEVCCVLCACVHHYCCQEKLDNVAPWGLAPGHSSTGTIRDWQSEHWLLVGEECFNFLTNKSGQGEIGHPRLDNASAWLLIEFQTHYVELKLQLDSVLRDEDAQDAQVFFQSICVYVHK